MTPLYHSMLLLLDAAGLLAFAGTIVWSWRRGFVLELRDVRRFFALWAAAFLLEYYILGPYSFIQMDEAGEMFVPLFVYLNTRFLGGQFAHHLGSGVDVTIYQTGSQLLSFDVLLFHFLPVWIAILVHKVVVLAVAFIGTYVLCRRSVAADRATAAFIAAFFTVSGEYMNHMTFAWGAALAFVPWLIYVIVVRADKPVYYRYVLIPVIASTCFASPTNWVLPNFAAIVLAAVLFQRFRWRIVVSLLICLLVLVVIWGDVLYGMFATAPYTERGGVVADVHYSAGLLAEITHDTWEHLWEDRYLLIGFALLPMLWVQRDPLRVGATLALLGPIVFYWVMRLFPWEAIGFRAFRQVSQHHVLIAESVLYLPLLARTTPVVPWFRRGGAWVRGRAPTASFALALALCLFAYYKGLNYVNFLYHAGQSAYVTVDSASRKDWRPHEPFRVITLRAPDIGTEPELPAGFYGLSPYDFYLNLKPTQHSLFWSRVRGGGEDQRVFVDWSKWIDGRYHVAEQLDLPLLRLANVGAIVSPIPLEGPGLALAAGPDQPPITRDRIRDAPRAYVAERLRRLVDFNDPYIYRLEPFVPMAFAAARILAVPDAADAPQLLERLDRLAAIADASAPALVARTADAAVLGRTAASLRVLQIDEIRNGYKVRIDAPEGGVVVLNTPWLPFWTAEAEGTALKPVSVNLIHLAVAVPAGSSAVTFRYHRPDLHDLFVRLATRVGSGAS